MLASAQQVGASDLLLMLEEKSMKSNYKMCLPSTELNLNRKALCLIRQGFLTFVSPSHDLSHADNKVFSRLDYLLVHPISGLPIY